MFPSKNLSLTKTTSIHVLLLLLFLVFPWYRFSPRRPVAPMERTTLLLPLSTWPSHLEPTYAGNAASGHVMRHLYEGLTRLEGSKATLALAKSFTVNPQGTQYTFYLRESFWSNGEKVLAKDLVQSWIDLLNPKNPAPNAYHLFCIKGAREYHNSQGRPEQVSLRALDEKTLVLELCNPLPDLLERLAFDSFYPVYLHSARKQKLKDAPQKHKLLISNGPFVLASEPKLNQEICLKKNSFFWNQEQVQLKRIEFHYLPDPLTSLSLFELEQLHWSGNPLTPLPLDFERKISESNTMDVHSIDYSFCNWIFLNTQKFPFYQPEIRQAIKRCMRPETFELAISPSAHATKSLLSPRHFHHLSEEKVRSQLRAPLQDDEESYHFLSAKELFERGCKQLGCEPRKFPPLVYLYNNSEVNKRVAQIIKHQIEKKLPITVELQAVEWQDFMSRLQMGNFQMARYGWRSQIPDPVGLLKVFLPPKGRTYNYSGWASTSYSELLDRIEAHRCNEEREKMLLEANAMIVRELPIIPLYYDAIVYVSHAKLKNVWLSDLGRIDFSYSFFEDSSATKETEKNIARNRKSPT